MPLVRKRDWLGVIAQINALEAERDEARRQRDQVIDELSSRTALPDEDRARLRSEWPSIVCAYCGGAHQGICNRVRVIELDPSGRPTRVVFRDEWEPNRDVIWPEDVFESYAQQFAERDQKITEARAKALLEQAADAEVQQESARYRRRGGPASIAAQVAREMGPERTTPPAA